METSTAIGIDLGSQTCRMAVLPERKAPARAVGQPVPTWRAAGLLEDPGPAWGRKNLPKRSVLAQVLVFLRAQAGRELGAEVLGAVISHPSYHGNEERNLLREAAFSAGFKAVRLVSEPAAVVYGLRDRIEPGQVIMLYSLGAGSLTISLYKKDGNNLVEVSTHKSDELSGYMLTGLLADQLSRHYRHASGDTTFNNPAVWERAAEEVKMGLSRAQEATCLPPPVLNPLDGYRLKVTRAELETLFEHPFNNSLRLCEAVLMEAHLAPGALAGLWLEGAGRAIPLLQRKLGEWIGQEPLLLDDYAVAAGAAGQTIMLEWPELPVPKAVLFSPPLDEVTPPPAPARTPAANQDTTPISRRPDRQALLDRFDAAEQRMAARDYEGALTEIQQAGVLLEKQRARVFFRQGQTLEKQALEPQTPGAPGRLPEELLEEAIKCYQKALEKDNYEQYREARDNLLILTNKRKAEIAFRRADAAVKEKNWYVATNELKKAIALDRSQDDYVKTLKLVLYLGASQMFSKMHQELERPNQTKNDKKKLITKAYTDINPLIQDLNQMRPTDTSYIDLIKRFRKFMSDQLGIRF